MTKPASRPVRTIRSLLVSSVAIALLATTPALADTAIPGSLKSSCSTQTPAPGYSFKLCDDGVPTAGGTTANATGDKAIRVPALYDVSVGGGWQGLPPQAPGAASAPGADTGGKIALDVDISVPTIPAPPGGYPVVVLMHGCCSGDKTSWEAPSFDTAGERWHYSNAWFAARGYVVINFTARGFVNGQNHGSTGEAQLDSRRYEINDYQYLAGLVADDPDFNVNPQKVVATGGSYGGGFAWMALTDPVWKSPGGNDMKLAAAAPRYGWTDLVDSLVPTGRHSQSPSHLSAFDGSDSISPVGTPKRTVLAALYGLGKTGIPPGTSHTTFPQSIDEAYACLNSTDPFESNPLCDSTINGLLPEFISDRSAYYQNDFFAKVASDPSYRIPIFNAGTLTDPLFPAVESLRMTNRLQSIVPGYPIQQYFGDYQHFVQNKAKEWGDVCGLDHHVCTSADYTAGDVNGTPASLVHTGATTRLNRFVDYYAKPPGGGNPSKPAFNVSASLQICPQNAGLKPADEPGDTFTASSFGALAPNTLRLDMGGTQTTTNVAIPNLHAKNSDPLYNLEANGGKCPVETTPAGPGVATYDSLPLPAQATMIGATKATIRFSATSSLGSVQLNARLYDVFPDGTAVMVDRGPRRLTEADIVGHQVSYELHGNGWRFAPGHRIRIELAQDDDPYMKSSSVFSTIDVSNVTLEIPVRESGVSFSTPGKATGGGSIDPSSGAVLDPATLLIKSSSSAASVNNKATFGFVAKFASGDSAPSGNLTYDDHGADKQVKVTSYSSLEIGASTTCAGGQHATINGTAEVNGTPGHQIRIEADDCDALLSGTAADAFEIHVDESSPDGYSASGVLVRILEHHAGNYSPTSISQGSEIQWDLRNRNNQVVASGVYFYHLEAGDARRVGRFTVVNFAQ